MTDLRQSSTHDDVNVSMQSAPGVKPTLLDVTDLDVSITDSQEPIIDGLNLSINYGEVVALVGESGSGKSVTALSLAQLLPKELSVTAGTIHFEGENILNKSDVELNKLRGREISMLFQQPQLMLDPTCRVHAQVSESLRYHHKFGRRQAFSRVVELLKDVGIPDPASRARSFSHELSGGMAQRVMIAAALAGDPKLLVADEPTTALDVTVQAQILRLLKAEQVHRQFSILLITHDLSIVSAFADQIAVMYAGRIVEQGPTSSIMKQPTHPYTRALVRCSLLIPENDGRLLSIPGSSAGALAIREGCRFAPRCSLATSNPDLLSQCCRDEPALQTHLNGWNSRCHASPQTVQDMGDTL